MAQDGGRRPIEREQWGPTTRAVLVVCVFASAVSLSLFVFTISPFASALVSAGFIAAGIVTRARSSELTSRWMATAALAGGIVSAVASIVIAAATG